MGLFDFFKKKEPPKDQEMESKLLLSMPMFKNGDRYSIVDVIAHLKNVWKLHIEAENVNDDTAVFSINGNTVAIAFMPVAIPREDLNHCIKYAYGWPTADEETAQMTGHAIVTVMGGETSTYANYLLLSKMLFSIMATSKAIGVYQGQQTLLLSKEQYLEYEEILEDNEAPVPLWVYIGVQATQTGNTLYTYGLKEFGFMELEVVNSQLDMEDLFNFINNICAYMLENNITLRDGETFGYTAEQKINITQSKGVNLDGDTLKLEM